MTDIEQSLEAALAQARNEALEEAARVVDADARDFFDSLTREALEETAARIRALKSQEKD